MYTTTTTTTTPTLYRVACLYTGRELWRGMARNPNNARHLARKSGNPGACYAWAHNATAHPVSL